MLTMTTVIPVESAVIPIDEPIPSRISQSEATPLIQISRSAPSWPWWSKPACMLLLSVGLVLGLATLTVLLAINPPNFYTRHGDHCGRDPYKDGHENLDDPNTGYTLQS